MMGRQDEQMQMMVLDLESMIPENHLLRQINTNVLTVHVCKLLDYLDISIDELITYIP